MRSKGGRHHLRVTNMAVLYCCCFVLQDAMSCRVSYTNLQIALAILLLLLPFLLSMEFRGTVRGWEATVLTLGVLDSRVLQHTFALYSVFFWLHSSTLSLSYVYRSGWVFFFSVPRKKVLFGRFFCILPSPFLFLPGRGSSIKNKRAMSTARVP